MGRDRRHVRLLSRQVRDRRRLGDRLATTSRCRVSPPTHARATRLSRDALLANLDDPSVEEVTDETYGGLKVPANVSQSSGSARAGCASSCAPPMSRAGRLQLAVPVVGRPHRARRRSARTGPADAPSRSSTPETWAPGWSACSSATSRARSTRWDRHRPSRGANSAETIASSVAPKARRCAGSTRLPARGEADDSARRCGPEPIPTC